MEVFLICPVRNASREETTAIRNYVEGLEATGVTVYWPARDTNQDDPTGLRICVDNRKALSEALEVHVWWSPDSKGSHFDLGMAWALGKNIFLANNVQRTPTKSYTNFLLEIDPFITR